MESYRAGLEATFGHLPLELDDLFLLEAFQIRWLPRRIPRPAMAAVIHEDDRLRRFLTTRQPSIEPWVQKLLQDPPDRAHLRSHQQTVVWEIAEELVAQRFPEALDARPETRWDIGELLRRVEVEGRTVLDVGAGTGWLTEQLAPHAGTVIAIEPVARLRTFIRDRVAGCSNAFVVDGFLDAIPLLRGSADVLVTSRAIGWLVEAELTEVERVLRPGGTALHFSGFPAARDPTPVQRTLTSTAWGYEPATYDEGGILRWLYVKTMTSGGTAP
jgi:SAM-dependent methyltransferase